MLLEFPRSFRKSFNLLPPYTLSFPFVPCAFLPRENDAIPVECLFRLAGDGENSEFAKGALEVDALFSIGDTNSAKADPRTGLGVMFFPNLSEVGLAPCLNNGAGLGEG